jgi:hypothetical protein
VANVPSGAVEIGISDTKVSTPVGSETNHSPAVIAADLPISEGSIAKVADSLSDHKHDKIDESSEGKYCYKMMNVLLINSKKINKNDNRL